jgi:hypothetical protein
MALTTGIKSLWLFINNFGNHKIQRILPIIFIYSFITQQKNNYYVRKNKKLKVFYEP